MAKPVATGLIVKRLSRLFAEKSAPNQNKTKQKKTEYVQENATYNILYDFEIQTDPQIPTR